MDLALFIALHLRLFHLLSLTTSQKDHQEGSCHGTAQGQQAEARHHQRKVSSFSSRLRDISLCDSF
jgi:hypothetical protein